MPDSPPWPPRPPSLSAPCLPPTLPSRYSPYESVPHRDTLSPPGATNHGERSKNSDAFGPASSENDDRSCQRQFLTSVPFSLRLVCSLMWTAWKAAQRFSKHIRKTNAAPRGRCRDSHKRNLQLKRCGDSATKQTTQSSATANRVSTTVMTTQLRDKDHEWTNTCEAEGWSPQVGRSSHKIVDDTPLLDHLHIRTQLRVVRASRLP